MFKPDALLIENGKEFGVFHIIGPLGNWDFLERLSKELEWTRNIRKYKFFLADKGGKTSEALYFELIWPHPKKKLITNPKGFTLIYV